jgi:hypothetical protein
MTEKNKLRLCKVVDTVENGVYWSTNHETDGELSMAINNGTWIATSVATHLATRGAVHDAIWEFVNW